ncbi:hypothetical protein COOONC_28100 [Cooperia oncophora]
MYHPSSYFLHFVCFCVQVAERPIRTGSPPLQRYAHPASAPPTFPVASAALSYSSRGMGIQESNLEPNDEVQALEKISQAQVQFPSCSNCAGPHAFVQCTKDTPLQKDGRILYCSFFQFVLGNS